MEKWVLGGFGGSSGSGWAMGEWLVGQWIVRVRKYLVCKTSYSGGKVGYQDFTQTEYEVCTFLPCINVYLA